jgi:hypothetical protein
MNPSCMLLLRWTQSFPRTGGALLAVFMMQGGSRAGKKVRELRVIQSSSKTFYRREHREHGGDEACI